MVFHVVQDSLWAFVLGAVVFILIAVLITLAVKNKMTDKILMGGLMALVIFSGSSLICFYQTNVQNNASFSKQLMDEYKSTSRRPFTAIQADLYRDQEAKDVFTRNGKETPVSIRLVSRDDNKMTMEFTVVGSSPYPKSDK